MEVGAASIAARLKKLLRFTMIYGPRRTLVKALGRLRVGVRGQSLSTRQSTAIAVIGRGQFALGRAGHELASRDFGVETAVTRILEAMELARMQAGSGRSSVRS